MTRTNVTANAKAMRSDVRVARDVLASIDRLIGTALAASSAATGDGYGRGGSGGPRSGISDPTGQAIAAASPALELHDALRFQWEVMTQSIDTVHRTLTRMASMTPTFTPEPRKCASGIDMDGYEHWGRRDAHSAPIRCDEYADPHRAGLCLGCWTRRYRWQRAEQVEVGT